MSALKTPYQERLEAKELAIYREFEERRNEGSPVSVIEADLMGKYDIYARSTIWQIRKRVEKRLAPQPTVSQTHHTQEA